MRGRVSVREISAALGCILQHGAFIRAFLSGFLLFCLLCSLLTPPRPIYRLWYQRNSLLLFLFADHLVSSSCSLRIPWIFSSLSPAGSPFALALPRRPPPAFVLLFCRRERPTGIPLLHATLLSSLSLRSPHINIAALSERFIAKVPATEGTDCPEEREGSASCARSAYALLFFSLSLSLFQLSFPLYLFVSVHLIEMGSEDIASSNLMDTSMRVGYNFP